MRDRTKEQHSQARLIALGTARAAATPYRRIKPRITPSKNHIVFG